MSYKSDLQQNNADLQSILDGVNALPDAGSGGGGAVPTCTVQLNVTNEYFINVINYTGLDDDGKPIWRRLIQPYGSSFTLTTVCGSIVYIMLAMSGTMTLTNASVVYNAPDFNIKVFAATNNEGETSTATITI